MQSAASSSVQWLLHLRRMRPHVNFVEQTLDFLDESERSIDARKRREKRAAEKLARKDQAAAKSAGLSANLGWERKMELLGMQRQNTAILPMSARYAALISAVAGMEWLVRMLDNERQLRAASFLRMKAREKESPDSARMMREVEKILEDSRLKNPSAAGILELFAKRAKLWNARPESRIFADLCVARNAVVHCGGAAKEFNGPGDLEKSIERLDGFCLIERFPGTDALMPAESAQIWIERSALRPSVEKAANFIAEVHKAHFGGGQNGKTARTAR